MADSGFGRHPHYERNGYRLLRETAPGSGDPFIDPSGHGTGEAANIFAIAPDCTVVGVKHGFSAAGTLEACIALNPDVMSNSWGFDIDHQSMAELQATDPNLFNELIDIETVILEAIDQNIIVMFSAGNGHRAFPACMPEVVAVGGVTVQADGGLEASSYASSFTSQLYPGREVPDFCGVVGEADFPAPLTGHIMLPVPENSDLEGENFTGGVAGQGWGIFSGTSAACPQAAGLAALIRARAGRLTPENVRQIMAVNSVDVTAGQSGLGDAAAVGPDRATGAGFLDAHAACEAAGAIV